MPSITMKVVPMSHLPIQRKMPLAVGQSLFWVPADHREKPHSIKVESVGRKWAVLSNRFRVDVQTGDVERQKFGYICPGVYLASEAQYFEFLEKARLWAEIRLKAQGPLDESFSVASLVAILGAFSEG